jgi:prepilin-type N-terminal cleavage/methylation domain-containing protein
MQSKKHNITKLAFRQLNGFTLIEVLLATVIGAMVMVAALAAFCSVNQMRQQLRYYSEVTGHGRYAINQIRNDLANFYRDNRSGQMRLVGIKAEEESRPADRLIIYAINQEKSFSGESVNDLYEVEYGFSRDEKQGEYFFSRRYGPVTNTSVGNKGGKLLRLSRNINSLEFEFYNGQTWQRGWDGSDGVASLVRVSMKLFDPADVHRPISMSQVISLKPLPTIKSEPEPAVPIIPTGDEIYNE